ncbi:hypothetical protein TRVA0_001S00122 [Trichomonascus vanleenenianus]|uniref:dihydroorotate dehydrogenase n=1 Tax=Trichomonascus vanleenenianus TaxID=2268995 RepID=UPI003EC9FCA6
MRGMIGRRAFSTTRAANAPFRKSRSSIMYKVSTAGIALAAVGIGGGLYYYKDAQSAIHEYAILPAIRLFFDAETSHKLAIEAMRYPALNPREQPNWDQTHDPDHLLQVTLFKNTETPITLRNPIGVAAGLDKDGKAIDSLFNLGFSYVEIGSITPLPQPGNPLPRFFRLEKDGAVINRYGFNSEGHMAVVTRLKTRLGKAHCYGDSTVAPVNNALHPGKALAVNLGKNKTGDEVQDYVTGVQNFGALADVLVINVSSPNTPGLRDLQSEEKLTNLLTTVVGERNTLQVDRKPPVVVKIAPDLTEPEIEAIAGAVKASKVDGVIVSNTTIERPDTLRTKSVAREQGGLSGKPLKPYSLRALRLLRKHLGKDITIIGCGGISSGEDAIEFARAGADFVQMYTAFAYKGPALAGKVKRDILKELNGKKWEDIVGK